MPMIARPMSPTITSPTPLPGDLKGLRCGGSYEVVELLGEGGMGQVWRARSRDLGGKDAAVKILLREVNDRPEALARFTQEISAIGAITALKENNVVEVYDTGLLAGDGRRYMLMEFCSGGSLESLLTEKGPLSFELTFIILGQAAAALAAAHEVDIVHRDFKPANILLINKNGYMRAKLSDFGIAKLIGDKLDEALFRTQSMRVLGSADYMAPEQANPTREIRADHRIDIYAFGVVLYRCMTGRTPYASRSVADAIVNVSRGMPFKRPSELRREVPPALDDLIMACLAHDREERIQSIAEVMRRFAEAIPAGLALLPYVAPRFVAKEAAPTAVTISDGVGPAVTQWVSNTSSSTYGGRVARRRAAVAAALAGLVFGGAAMALVDRLASSPEAPVLARAREARDTSHAPRGKTPAVAEAPSSVATMDAGAGASTVATPIVAATTVRPASARAAVARASAGTTEEKAQEVGRERPPVPPVAPSPPRRVVPARAPSKPATTPRDGNGLIVVRVNPWANVWIDGVSYETTPVRATLPVGVHKVLLVGDGHREKVSVTVTPAGESIIERKW
jgi:serine/threonine-protein kinase